MTFVIVMNMYVLKDNVNLGNRKTKDLNICYAQWDSQKHALL